MQSNKQRLNLFSYKNQQTNHLLKDKLNHELLQKNPTNKNDIITLLQLIETYVNTEVIVLLLTQTDDVS